MVRGWCLALIGQLVLSAPILSQSSPVPTRSSKVPGRIPIEALLGAGGSVVGAYLGARIGAALLGPRGGEDPGLLGALIGTIAGVPLGSAAGVYFGARSVDGVGRYANALGGSGLGLGSFLLVRPLAGLDPDHPSFWAAFLGFPVAGAVLFEEIGIRNRRLSLQLAPGAHGVRLSARVTF